MIVIHQNIQAVFDANTSKRAFEEDVLLQVLAMHQQKMKVLQYHMILLVKEWTARYQHETVALAFSITEEAEEDGQYGSIASSYTKALARSMASTKKLKQANHFK